MTSPSPYDVLGVPRDADRATIKRAYRRKAGQTHPDRGGSAEQFGRVNSAYLLLADPARRKRFDETGQADEPVADNEAAYVLHLIVWAFDAVLGEAGRKELDPLRHDMLGSMLNALSQRRHEVDRGIAKIRHEKAALARLMGKFKHRKDGRNLIEELIAGRIAEFDRQIDAGQQELGRLDAALTMLRDYDFLHDVAPLMTWASTGSTTFKWNTTA